MIEPTPILALVPDLDPVLVLGLLNLALIGSLPRIFFRRGRLNAQWWLTAAPFIAAAASHVAALAGATAPMLRASGASGSAAVALHAGSILLIGFTLGTHREPLALWHQRDGEPRSLVTHGAYRRIRHPFYAAFIMTLFGVAFAWPHWLTAAALVYGCARLSRVAAGEEAAILGSPLGAEYRVYMARTGRFWPGGSGRTGGGSEAAAAAARVHHSPRLTRLRLR